MSKKLPQFGSYTECRKFIANQWQNEHLRPGQSLCNKYEIDPKLESQIWEEHSLEAVIQRVWNFTNNQEYQNL